MFLREISSSVPVCFKNRHDKRLFNSVQGKKQHLGCFATDEEAAGAKWVSQEPVHRELRHTIALEIIKCVQNGAVMSPVL
jgi:hypothetical protein